MATRKPISHSDPTHIEQNVYDEELQAKRVIIVGAQMPEIKLPDTLTSNITIDTTKIEAAISKMAQPQVAGPSHTVQTIEIPTTQVIVQKEVQVLEVPKIVLQDRIVEITKEVPRIEIKTIEIPVVHTELKIVEIEKPVIVHKQADLPKGLVVCLVLQAAVTLIVTLLHVIK